MFDIVNASLKTFYLWRDIVYKHLTTDMRAHLSGDAETITLHKCSWMLVMDK